MAEKANLPRPASTGSNIAISPMSNHVQDSYDQDLERKLPAEHINGHSPNASVDCTNEDQAIIGERYSIWTSREKVMILSGSASAAIFSSLSVQIYLPALNILAGDFHVSPTKINFSVTAYMIMQGVVPMVLGGFSDRIGRRPAFLICFVIYMGANIGLALCDSYASLIALRCLQATGIAATQTLAQAVLTDIITSAERGAYIALITLPAVLGTTVGPLGGGALAQRWGWRSIFWFLTVAGAMCFLGLIMFFPETNRGIVGDGSVTPPKWYRPPFQVLKSRLAHRNQVQATQNFDSRDETAAKRPRGWAPSNIFASLILLRNLEFLCLLIYGSIMYATIFAYAAALPSQFAKIYHFQSFNIGLMYLPNIGGTLVAAATIGKVMNWNYARHARKLGLPPVDRSKQMDLTNFPIERARLEIAIPAILMTAVITIGWGWTLDAETTLALPCVLLFAVGLTYISVINIFNALISDYYRKSAATAVATNWLVRCMVGAGMSAAILPLINAVGVGWAYTIVAALLIIFSPLVFISMWKGLEWRQARARSLIGHSEVDVDL